MLNGDNFDLEKLISEVQKRPALWDMKAPEYTDRIKKRTSWEEIINLFSKDNATKEENQILGTTLQKKWKNARDRYSRDVIKRMRKSRQGAKKGAPYLYATQMSFLEDTVQHRATDSSINNGHSQTLLEDVEINEDAQTLQAFNENNVLGVPMQQSNTSASSNLSIQSTEKAKIGKKRKMSLVKAKLIEALESNAKRRDRRENEEDDDRLFLLSLLPHLKLLPPHLKLSARLSILEAVNKYVVQPVTDTPTPNNVQSQSPPLHYQKTPNHLRTPFTTISAADLSTTTSYTRCSAGTLAYQQTQFHIRPQAPVNTSAHQQEQLKTCTRTTEITPIEITTEPLQSPTESVRSYFTNYSTDDSGF